MRSPTASEGLYAPDRNPIMRLMADEGIRALARELPVVAQSPGDIDARGTGALWRLARPGRRLALRRSACTTSFATRSAAAQPAARRGAYGDPAPRRQL